MCVCVRQNAIFGRGPSEEGFVHLTCQDSAQVWVQWPTPIILAILEVEIRKTVV
jgi:hypothetical protein